MIIYVIGIVIILFGLVQLFSKKTINNIEPPKKNTTPTKTLSPKAAHIQRYFNLPDNCKITISVEKVRY
jgi:hypothetical protein